MITATVEPGGFATRGELLADRAHHLCAVRRMAADQLDRAFHNVAYFPSYEIITAAHTRGRFFGADLRSVAEDGVARVMSLFMQHVAEGGEASAPTTATRADAATAFDEDARRIVNVICDEDLLAEPPRRGP